MQVGTCYKKIIIKSDANSLIIDSAADNTDNLTLCVNFPASNSTNDNYSDLVEDVKIELSAKQVIE